MYIMVYSMNSEDMYSIQILVIIYQNTHHHNPEDDNMKWNPVDDDLLNVL